jgi:hypothetical protein
MPLLGTDGLDTPVLGDRRTRGAGRCAGRLPTLAAATAAGEPTAVGNGRKGLSTAVGNGRKGLSGTAVLHAPLCCTPGDPEGVSAVRSAEGVSAVRRADGMSVVRRKGLC